METEQEQFEQVRKVLALKRHEQPPPGYFNGFSSKVISRILALEAARPVTLRQRLGLDFDFRPAMIGVFGVIICGLLLVGVITSFGLSQPASPAGAAGDPLAFFVSPMTTPALAGGVGLNPIVSPEEIPSSTVPVSEASSASSPFGQLTPQPVQRASFTFGSGN